MNIHVAAPRTRRSVSPRVWLLSLMACIPAYMSDAAAGTLRIQGAGGAFSLPVTSLKEARLRTVVRQQYDFSCGSAAVATLLTYHYDRPVSEAEAFEFMYRTGDQEKIRREGFSMLDMKRFLDDRGLRSDGFRLNLDRLAEIGVPGIALVDTHGYRHFVVVRGMRQGKVLLADPAAGSVAVDRADFERIWNGVLLAARSELETARRHFNDSRDWQAWPDAPIAQGVDRAGLGMFTLSLPGRNELGR
ncbi:MAG: C39 family peptidase [Gammaproteobacteria bacterium]|nr:C39 family peptidase [Gammaproteobacteria bacterium]